MLFSRRTICSTYRNFPRGCLISLYVADAYRVPAVSNFSEINPAIEMFQRHYYQAIHWMIANGTQQNSFNRIRK